MGGGKGIGEGAGGVLEGKAAGVGWERGREEGVKRREGGRGREERDRETANRRQAQRKRRDRDRDRGRDGDGDRDRDRDRVRDRVRVREREREREIERERAREERHAGSASEGDDAGRGRWQLALHLLHFIQMSISHTHPSSYADHSIFAAARYRPERAGFVVSHRLGMTAVPT